MLGYIFLYENNYSKFSVHDCQYQYMFLLKLVYRPAHPHHHLYKLDFFSVVLFQAVIVVRIAVIQEQKPANVERDRGN